MKEAFAWIFLAFFTLSAADGVYSERKRIKDRSEALSFAFHVKEEITHFMSPMGYIVSSFDGESFNGVSAEEAPSVIEMLSPGVGCGQLLMKIMRSDAENVVGECERLCAVLGAALEKEKKNSSEKRGVRVIYPLFCGAVLFIMLI